MKQKVKLKYGKNKIGKGWVSVVSCKRKANKKHAIIIILFIKTWFPRKHIHIHLK